MENLKILIIDTDQGFSERFFDRLKFHKLDGHVELINIFPSTKNKTEIVDKCVSEANEVISKTDISFVLVDIHINESGAKVDTSGIQIANNIKELNPDKPIYNLTGHVSWDEQLELLTDATLELNDGVIVKSYLDGENFSEERLYKLLNHRYTKTIKLCPQKSTDRNNPSNCIDFAIITALFEDEFQNIKPIFNLVNDDKDPCGEYKYGNIENDSGKISTIVATHQPTTGMVDAAVLAAEMILRFKPKYLLMSGVCGGKDKDELKFGDIIVATSVQTFQKGKVTEESFEIERESCEIDRKIIKKIREKQDDIKYEIMKSDPGRRSYYQKFPLNIWLSPIACSTAVINKEGYFQQKIASQDRNILAVDMESYAVARACQLLNGYRTKPIIVKSIMDKTKEKDDNSKSFAAFTSAQFLKFLVKTILV